MADKRVWFSEWQQLFFWPSYHVLTRHQIKPSILQSACSTWLGTWSTRKDCRYLGVRSFTTSQLPIWKEVQTILIFLSLRYCLYNFYTFLQNSSKKFCMYGNLIYLTFDVFFFYNLEIPFKNTFFGVLFNDFVSYMCRIRITF